MKVSSIAPYKYQKMPAFKGLWGDPKVDSAISTDSIYNHSQEFYYPFKDEQDSDIKNAIDSHSDSFEAGWDETLGDTIMISATVSLMERLPFTKEEYQNYKKGKYDADKFAEKRLLIENSLETNKLSKYKNHLTDDKNADSGVVGFFKRIFKK